ncbi:MAG TPA: hypothetical protein VGU20_13110 [Stellaceae bacterium]|nr:hypothetical protein [Stellaceae bacterium]
MAVTFDPPAGLLARRHAQYFYVYMAISCAAVAFIGFAPTYWIPVAEGTFQARPIVHLHGILFFSWTLFLVLETWLAASGRITKHRAIGMIGISLATAMTLLGTVVMIGSTQAAAAVGLADAGKAFMIVPLGGLLFFATAIALAIANVHRPEVHKRLMLLASISILDAAIFRWFLTFLPGTDWPPLVALAAPPALVASILLLVAIVFDWRIRGRPHPVYVIGGTLHLALKVLQVPISATAAWHSVASSLLALAQ